jgi:hypothetical protein
METIPPAGLAPTQPPPPRHRAKRALRLAVLACLIAAVAARWHIVAQPGQMVVSVGDEARLGTVFRRLLFLVSVGLQLLSVSDATKALKAAPKAAALTLLLAVGWLAGLVWLGLTHG